MPAYTPILATLGYIMSPDGDAVLMIHRNARADDLHYGKYNGLGGKLDAGEDVVSGMRREIREEGGIEAEELVRDGAARVSRPSTSPSAILPKRDGAHRSTVSASISCRPTVNVYPLPMPRLIGSGAMRFCIMLAT